MKRALLIVILLLCGASLLHGQVADSTSWQGQGRTVLKTGRGMMLGGAVTAAAGGGIMLLAASPRLNALSYQGEFNENMLPPFVFILGMCCAITGTAVVVAGVPVTIAGRSMMQSDLPWRDARYDRSGPGVILEGGYYLPDIFRARAALGYHFNSHLFLGGGVAPGSWRYNSSPDDIAPKMSLPLYADFRWSMCDRMISPYLGLSAGMELADSSPYLGAGIGVRIRTARTSTRSFWSALSGEVAGGYMRAGITMGYSF